MRLRILLEKVPFRKVCTYCKDIYFDSNVLIITGDGVVYNAGYRFFSVWLGCKEEKALTFA